MVNDGASRWGCAKGVTVSTSYHLPVTLLFREIACTWWERVRKKSIASSPLAILFETRESRYFLCLKMWYTISIKVSNYTRSYLPRPVKPKKRYFGRCFWSEIYLAEKNFMVHHPDTYVNKYVFLSFMSLLLKRVSCFWQTRYSWGSSPQDKYSRRVPPNFSFSLSLQRLFASASSTSEVYLRVSLPVPVSVELAPRAWRRFVSLHLRHRGRIHGSVRLCEINLVLASQN